MDEPIRAKTETLRHPLPQDGGDCEIVSIEGKTVTMRLKGACGSCPFAMETLKGYVQETLRQEIDPELVVERCE